MSECIARSGARTRRLTVRGEGRRKRPLKLLLRKVVHLDMPCHRPSLSGPEDMPCHRPSWSGPEDMPCHWSCLSRPELLDRGAHVSYGEALRRIGGQRRRKGFGLRIRLCPPTCQDVCQSLGGQLRPCLAPRYSSPLTTRSLERRGRMLHDTKRKRQTRRRTPGIRRGLFCAVLACLLTRHGGSRHPALQRSLLQGSQFAAASQLVIAGCFARSAMRACSTDVAAAGCIRGQDVVLGPCPPCID